MPKLESCYGIRHTFAKCVVLRPGCATARADRAARRPAVADLRSGRPALHPPGPARDIASESSAPLQLEGLALRKGTVTRIILASLIPTPQRVRIQHGGRAARLRLLDERNAEAAMRDPERFRAQVGELLDTHDGSLALELLPYAVARIDVIEATEN